jgi:hypothetical protein
MKIRDEKLTVLGEFIAGQQAKLINMMSDKQLMAYPNPVEKTIVGTNFGPDNGCGYYEVNHYDDTIEITYVPEEDVVLWPGEYAHIEYYLETPECDEYLK